MPNSAASSEQQAAPPGQRTRLQPPHLVSGSGTQRPQRLQLEPQSQATSLRPLQQLEAPPVSGTGRSQPISPTTLEYKREPFLSQTNLKGTSSPSSPHPTHFSRPSSPHLTSSPAPREEHFRREKRFRSGRTCRGQGRQQEARIVGDGVESEARSREGTWTAGAGRPHCDDEECQPSRRNSATGGP